MQAISDFDRTRIALHRLYERAIQRALEAEAAEQTTTAQDNKSSPDQDHQVKENGQSETPSPQQPS